MNRTLVTGRPSLETVLKVARWREAESQLFARLIPDAELHERCISLIATVIEELQNRCPAKELALQVDPGIVAAEVAAESLGKTADMDMDLIGAAAMANHWWRLNQPEDGAALQRPMDASPNGCG
jgi:hypothetical protein